VSSSYSRIGYPSGFFPFSNFKNNWTIGASVQVPLYTGGRQKADEAAARADLDESRARLQQTRELSGLDTRLAWAELLAARATWESTAGTVQQAQRAYEIADVRYRAGVSTQLELSDARLQLQQAQASRAQAARDVQVARAHVALLPDLPVPPTAGGAAATAASAPRTTTPAPQQQVNQPQTQPTTAATAFQTFGGQGAQTGR
jgi:outer membrane protein TolC